MVNGYNDLADVGAGASLRHPVTDVSYYDVVKWCNAKSEMEGLTPVYQTSGGVYRLGQIAPTVESAANGYRLPTEVEWEWAARGGVSSKGYEFSGGNEVDALAWHSSSDGAKPVGTKTANELGIHDMSGNVWEWCEDLVSAHLGRRMAQSFEPYTSTLDS